MEERGSLTPTFTKIKRKILYIEYRKYTKKLGKKNRLVKFQEKRIVIYRKSIKKEDKKFFKCEENI